MSKRLPGATLLTKEDFGNFVLRAEFRAHPAVNSALMLRQGRPQPAGYELQIRDKLLTDRTGGSYLTGSIVNVQNAPEGTKILPDRWNAFEVALNGDHIVVLYNGTKVIDVRDSRREYGRDRSPIGASGRPGRRVRGVPQPQDQAIEIATRTQRLLGRGNDGVLAALLCLVHRHVGGTHERRRVCRHAVLIGFMSGDPYRRGQRP